MNTATTAIALLGVGTHRPRAAPVQPLCAEDVAVNNAYSSLPSGASGGGNLNK